MVVYIVTKDFYFKYMLFSFKLFIHQIILKKSTIIKISSNNVSNIDNKSAYQNDF